MKLSTRTRYALRAMVELARNSSTGPLRLKVIAKRQDISVKYLEQLMAVLKSSGFVRSVRGSKGGYTLARAPDLIKLSDIFHSLEGTVTTTECVCNEDYCNRSTDCAARQVWMQVQMAIEKVLQSLTLQDLVNMSNEHRKFDYQI